MRRALLLPLMMAAVTLPPGAQAKEEITRLKICGASQCKTITDLTTLRAVMTDIGGGSVAPPERAPFYTMRPEKTREWNLTWPRYLYVPSTNAVRVTWFSGERYWDRLGFSAPLLKEVTRNLKPYPTPQTWSAAGVTAPRMAARPRVLE